MKQLKIMVTGATGMVGEGVLLHCLQSGQVSEVLMINRRHYPLQHPRLKEVLVPDFNKPDTAGISFAEYDACFYCAGVSSISMKEPEYSRITYDTTLNFARKLQQANPQMVFTFVTGAQTDSSGRQMWQRVKGRTEEALLQLGFRGQYNFRPGFMKPVQGQQNVRWFFKPVIALFPHLFPKQSLTLHQVGEAMIRAVYKGYPKGILEIADIKKLAATS